MKSSNFMLSIFLSAALGACAPIFNEKVIATATPALILASVDPNMPAKPCDAFLFIENVNYPDDTQVQAGSEFTKTWKLLNIGSCTWTTGYTITYSGYADKMSGVPQPLAAPVPSGQEVDVSVRFTAPMTPGMYLSSWVMANSNGVRFFGMDGKPFWVKIIVHK
jgi:hypothetical protein